MIYQNSFQNWIFDLDNTMYDINLGLFKKISNRITDFIMSKYSLDIDQAKKIQKEYYLKYGLTLRGLIVEKKLEPEEFLDYVHDVEHPELKKNDQLIVFSNSNHPGIKFLKSHFKNKKKHKIDFLQIRFNVSLQ